MSRLSVIMVSVSLLLASCGEVVDPVTEYEAIEAPARFRGDVTTTVMFTDKYSEECIKAGLKVGGQIQACSLKGPKAAMIIVPNPCKARGNYARLLCHEIGHQNGWGGNHER